MKKLAPFLLLAAVGCTDELPSYNEIDGFRLLAVGADQPWLQAEKTARLETLLASNTSTAGTTFDWSWCPFTSGSAGGYECAASREELQAQIDENVPELGIVIPPYELGTTATVGFTYPFLEPVVEGLCKALFMLEDIPAFVTLPSCDGKFPITIRVEVANGDDRIVAVKELQLVFGFGAQVNTNPTATTVTASLDSNGDGKGDGPEIVLGEDGLASLARDKDYEIRVDLDEGQAETYTKTDPETMMSEEFREALTVTWFVQGGSLERGRTGFIADQVSIDIARSNVWTTPKAVDYEEDVAEIILVIRDGRGGTSWLRRTVRLDG